MKMIDPSQAKAVTIQMRAAAQSNDGKVPTDLVRGAANQLGCSERTVWRWLANDPVTVATAEPRLSKEHLSVVAGENGRLKRAWRELHTTDRYSRSYRQFTRDFALLEPMVRNGLRHGVKEGLKHGLYLKGGEQHGRLDRVLFDHTEADIRLRRMYAGRLEMFRPWVTLLLDSATRFILATSVIEGDGVRGDPNTESLAALLASVIHGQQAGDGTFVGGVPSVVQFDNAKAHLADAMLSGYLTLGIATHAITPGSPWEDGRVERLMRTMNDDFLSALPGYTAALDDRYGRTGWTPADCLTIDEFTMQLSDWVDRYNYEHIHSSLGVTPFDAWRTDTTMIRQVDDALVRRSFTAVRGVRTISKNGVRYRDIDYVHSDLGSLVGRKVTLRCLPNDWTFIDVYIDDVYLCTAVPHTRLSREERIEIVRSRASKLNKVDRLIKSSRKRIEQRDLDANPLIAPERQPGRPKRVVTTSAGDDTFLAFMESVGVPAS
jgi:putative transposase